MVSFPNFDLKFKTIDTKYKTEFKYSQPIYKFTDEKSAKLFFCRYLKKLILNILINKSYQALGMRISFSI